MKASDGKFQWKAELRFEGTEEQFNSLMGALGDAPVEIDVPEWVRRPHHLSGCMPFPLEGMLGKARIDRLMKDSLKLKLRYVQDIHGGIRTPHMHHGEEVVLLGREKFKMLARDVAAELAQAHVEGGGDYVDVMVPIGGIYGATPIEIP